MKESKLFAHSVVWSQTAILLYNTAIALTGDICKTKNLYVLSTKHIILVQIHIIARSSWMVLEHETRLHEFGHTLQYFLRWVYSSTWLSHLSYANCALAEATHHFTFDHDQWLLLPEIHVVQRFYESFDKNFLPFGIFYANRTQFPVFTVSLFILTQPLSF